jgi:hypothetical protein
MPCPYHPSWPHPLFLRKSDNAENRTRDLWICNQELRPLDHRGCLQFIHSENILPDWSQPLQLSYLKLPNLNHWHSVLNKQHNWRCDALRSTSSAPFSMYCMGRRLKLGEYATRLCILFTACSPLAHSSTLIIKFLPQRQKTTEQANSSGNVSRGACFESRLGHRISQLRVFVGFFNRSEERRVGKECW